MFSLIRHPARLASPGLRYTSTTTEPAPLLSRMKDDLKTALRSKDKPRLNVIRAILSTAANASKGPTPMKTDIQVLTLLNKRLAASKAASEEFAQAKRDDLKAKQDAEIAVMDEYARQVKTFPEEEISKAIEQAIHTVKAAARVNAGNILKELFRPDGMLDGIPAERSQVARMVQGKLETKP